MDHDLLSGSGLNGLLPVRHGHMLVNRHDTIVGRSLDYYGEYFEQEVRLFRQIVREGDLVVDAGANIGAHTVPLARMVGPRGRVLAYEPVRQTFQMLCANVAINSLGWVECHYAALGARDEMLALRDVAMDVPENYGAVELSAIPGDILVPGRRLDGEFSGDRLRLLKIDVEGMEADVLEGARATLARLRPALYVENDRVERSRELLMLLDQMGYACWWFLPSFHNPGNFRGRAEPLYPPGFIDDGSQVRVAGMGINLFCLPKEAGARLAGLKPVLNADEHPLHRHCTQRFVG